MATTEIRVPKQERAVKKRDAIIRASYELFCRKGYYQTNTAQIAKEAGVSTGIVYSYFQNKEDILLQVVRLYLAELKEALDSVLSGVDSGRGLSYMVEACYERLYASHTMRAEAHDEFWAMALRKEAIKELFKAFETELLQELYRKLACRQDVSQTLLREKLRLSYHILECSCHDAISPDLSKAERETLKQLTVSAVVDLLERKIN